MTLSRAFGTLALVAAMGAATGEGLFALAACEPKTAKTAKDAALTAADLACVFGSAIVDPDALATFCKLEKAVTPLLSDLVGMREGARRAGVIWQRPDAGPDAAR